MFYQPPFVLCRLVPALCLLQAPSSTWASHGGLCIPPCLPPPSPLPSLLQGILCSARQEWASPCCSPAPVSDHIIQRPENGWWCKRAQTEAMNWREALLKLQQLQVELSMEVCRDPASGLFLNPAVILRILITPCHSLQKLLDALYHPGDFSLKKKSKSEKVQRRLSESAMLKFLQQQFLVSPTLGSCLCYRGARKSLQCLPVWSLDSGDKFNSNRLGGWRKTLCPEAAFSAGLVLILPLFVLSAIFIWHTGLLSKSALSHY